MATARTGTERGRGMPLTDEERLARHLSLYGTEELPERGTGLAQELSTLGFARTVWLAGGGGAGAGIGVYAGNRIAGTGGGILGAILGSVLGVVVVDRIIHAMRTQAGWSRTPT